MKSYLTITEDRETGEINIEAKLLPKETYQLQCIRHMVVEQITSILDPECKKITFKF